MATRVSRLIRVACDASAARDTARVAASRAAPAAAAAASRPEAAVATSSRAARSGSPRSRRVGRGRGYPVPGLDVTDKDLESDEAIWTMYENWCKVYNMERDHEEMTRRFPVFKEAANIVHAMYGRLGFGADGKHMTEGYSLIPLKFPKG